MIPWSLGGRDPLDGISAWKRLDPTPHWHFVSYGLSELYGKDSDDPLVSGFGFELTFRLACDPAEADPPMWAYSLMQNLARYVFDSGNALGDGQWMNTNGPIALTKETQLQSLAFILDPEVPAIDTPHGRVEFVQIVGMTLDEEAALKRWETRKLLETLLPHMPLWVTDLSRHSLLDEADVRTVVEAGAARDGSSTGALLSPVLGWNLEKRLLRAPIFALRIGANQLVDFLSLLPLRLPFGLALRIVGPQSLIIFDPGDHEAISEEDGGLRVQLTPQMVTAIAQKLRPLAGSYVVPGLNLRWDVQRSLIRDAAGKVVRTIG
jgi:hypothetical protein